MLIPLIILLCAIVLTGIFNARKNEYYAQWCPADGVVTEVGQIRKFKRQVGYTYVVNGAEYASDEWLRIRHDAMPESGERVTVWYDSEDCSRSSLSKPQVSALDYIAPMFPAVVLAIGVTLAGRNRGAQR